MRALLFCLWAPVLAACSMADGVQSGEWRVLTYNVHGLPSEITGDDTPARLSAIGPLLPDYDLVGLQEDFIEENHALLTADVDHRTRAYFSEALSGRPTGSGLTTLARLPLVERVHTHYQTCFGVLDSASDCLGSKGFQVLRLRVSDGVELDHYNTHLEAGRSQQDADSRDAQIDMLLASLGGFSKGRAVLMTGDFNIHTDGSAETQIGQFDRLMDGGSLRDACAELSCDDAHRIDRVLFRAGPGLELEARSWSIEEQFVDENGVDLSDHQAVSATLAFAATPP